MSISVQLPNLLDEVQVAKILNVTVASMRKWRWEGRGPKYIKIGASVRYHPDDIAELIETNRRSSTADDA